MRNTRKIKTVLALVLFAYFIVVIRLYPRNPWISQQESYRSMFKYTADTTTSSRDISKSPTNMALENILNKHVDTKIGTVGDGNVWVGASVPHGMVKIGIDSKFTQMGYSPTKPITGLSMFHVSGTGGGDSYQVLNVHPWLGSMTEFKDTHKSSNAWKSPFSLSSNRRNETAKPSFFAVTLDQVYVHVEMTATAHTSILRYFYSPPISSTSPLSIVDTSKKIFALFDVSRTPGPEDMFRGGEISFDKSLHLFTGYGKYREHWAGGLGLASDEKSTYQIYFCVSADDKYRDFGIWNSKDVYTQQLGAKQTYGTLGGFLVYDIPSEPGNEIAEIRIGISYVSVDKACTNLAHELHEKSFDDVVEEGRKMWKHKLDRIRTFGPVYPDLPTMFYSAMYRSFMMPVNRTDENPKWKSGGSYYDDFYTLWDTFRTLHPLYSLLFPKKQADIVNSLIDIQQNEGWFSDSRVAGINGIVQGGSHATTLIAEAYLKKLPGINWEKAYEALINDAENESHDFLYEGRGNLNEWKMLGYIPTISAIGNLYHRSASRTMEYAFNDYCVAVLARGLGKHQDYDKYKMRSMNWKNLWNKKIRSNGIDGFISPRLKNGQFSSGLWADPSLCSPLHFDKNFCHFSNGEFYEDSSWTYSLFVPHDPYGLIRQVGGSDKFLKRLDTYFYKEFHDPSNEPGFLIPYLYIYIGRHDKMVDIIRKIVRSNFSALADGIPGNDDGGALSTYLVFNLVGIFPLAGTDLYFIGTPHFKRTVFSVDDSGLDKSKRKFIIEAINLSVENKYVIGAFLNGRVLKQAWLRHADIVQGGHLVLQMSKDPFRWDEIPPPSPIV